MDTIEFDFFKNPSKADQEGNSGSYHVRINNSQTIGLKELVKRIHNSCSMTPSDIYGVLEALKGEISSALSHGQKVNIEGLCQFRLILGSKKAGRCSGKENGKEIGFKKIRITPYKEFNEETKAKLMPLAKSEGRHSTNISDEEITAIMFEHLKKNGTVTRKKLEEICGITRYKASMFISAMTEKGILKNIGYRTHPVYAATENTGNI